ncbi:MAG TPA: sigma factor-like helix-turn-helix DNA-binding protein, partial [Candidatus Hodarchaeales archaeon]|nr:sigma factor-like helix-turn-helix DNA-binding protein [Candidatus Hodarchaeales archaeon]
EDTSRWIRQLSIQLEETNALLRVLVKTSLDDVGGQTSEKIALLNQFGLRPSEIARILGISSNAVAVQLHRLRKRDKTLGEKTKESPNQ